MKALLEVRRVSKKYGNGSTALSDVSFSIQEGEFVSIIGPSGAGKSTLLRCINRMIEVSSGEVVFQNVNVTKLGKKQLKQVRRTIGMIFQHYNLVNRLSVIENVLHGRLGYKSTLAGMLGLYNEEEKKKAVEILAMLGLQDQIYKRADQLSGGQKQRVGIAGHWCKSLSSCFAMNQLLLWTRTRPKPLWIILKQYRLHWGLPYS